MTLGGGFTIEVSGFMPIKTVWMRVLVWLKYNTKGVFLRGNVPSFTYEKFMPKCDGSDL